MAMTARPGGGGDGGGGGVGRQNNRAAEQLEQQIKTNAAGAATCSHSHNPAYPGSQNASTNKTNESAQKTISVSPLDSANGKFDSQCDSDEEEILPATEAPVGFEDIIEYARANVGQEVYPPSDDTFLLIEALDEEAKTNNLFPVRDLKLPTQTKVQCLEIGSGSGAVLTSLVRIFARTISLNQSSNKVSTTTSK